MGIVMGMIFEGNGRDEGNGQPAVGAMSMKEDVMGIDEDHACMRIDGWVWRLEWMWLTDSVGYEA